MDYFDEWTREMTSGDERNIAAPAALSWDMTISELWQLADGRPDQVARLLRTLEDEHPIGSLQH